LKHDTRFHGIQSRFHDFFDLYPEYSNRAVDGVLLDLGVSSFQLDQGSRGFSYRFAGPLDMRMNQEDSLTAADVVNGYEARLLQQIFRDYGDIRNSHKIVDTILQARLEKPFTQTDELANLLGPLFSPARRNKMLSRIFQSIRIEVNQELHSLKHVLLKAHDALKPGGMLVVIAYHSAEDLIVKEFIRFAESECTCHPKAPICTCDKKRTMIRPVRKAIKADPDEQEENPRARSARMRVAIRVEGGKHDSFH